MKQLRVDVKKKNSTNYLKNLELLESLKVEDKETAPPGNYSQLNKVFEFLEDQNELENIQ